MLTGIAMFVGLLLLLRGRRSAWAATPYGRAVLLLGVAVLFWDQRLPGAAWLALVAALMPVAWEAWRSRGLASHTPDDPDRLVTLAHAVLLAAIVAVEAWSLEILRADEVVTLTRRWSIVADTLQVALPAGVGLWWVLITKPGRKRTAWAVSIGLTVTVAALLLSLRRQAAWDGLGETAAAGLATVIVAGLSVLLLWSFARTLLLL